MMHYPLLHPGDTVELIAPAARCSDEQLSSIKELLISWGLNCIVDPALFGKDLLCANSDVNRFTLLKNALYRPETKAIICVRGGYGSLRLIPELAQLSQPSQSKLLIGMSDITALNLYLMQQWQWPILHAALALDKFSPESIAAVKYFLFNRPSQVQLHGYPLNKAAQKSGMIQAALTGGNLCMVQTSIGTIWQMNAKNKIIFLEEINERGYRIDRMLVHLQQAGLFHDIAAIIFGDFIQGFEPNGSSLIDPVLARFAENCSIPVVQIKGLGHGPTNFPIPLGMESTLKLGISPELSFNDF